MIEFVLKPMLTNLSHCYFNLFITTIYISISASPNLNVNYLCITFTIFAFCLIMKQIMLASDQQFLKHIYNWKNV